MKMTVVKNLIENGFKIEVVSALYKMKIEETDVGIFYSKYYSNYVLILSRIIDKKFTILFNEEFEDLNELYETIENKLDLDFGFERL